MGMRAGVAALALSALALTANASPTYVFVDLGQAGPGGSEGFAINDAGQVGGVDAPGAQRATVWNGATRTFLGPSSGTGAVHALNSLGQAAGWAGYGGMRAATWTGGAETILDVLPGGMISIAYGINNVGQAVGWSSGPANGYHATLWNVTGATDLGTLGGDFSGAFGINNAGQIVGYSFAAGSSIAHATLWSGGSIIDLNPVNGGYSAANGINDAGLIVGGSGANGDGRHATLWVDGIATDLGTPGGAFSDATSINSIGQIVGYGYAADGSAKGILWDHLNLIVMDDLMDQASRDAGWEIDIATGINDSGWITGTAYNRFNNEGHAFLLRPADIPEPATLALLLATLPGIALARRRRG